MSTQAKQWVLVNPPTGNPDADTFKLETKTLPEIVDGQVLVKVKYLGNDPVFRTMISPAKDGKRSPISPGDKMIALGIGEVVQSKSTKWTVGQDVTGAFGWTDYAVLPEAAITGAALDLPGKQAASLSVIGASSFTAYAGIFDVLKVGPDHTVVITGAAGGVGSFAVQMAKHLKAKRVVGIAGSDEKCRWVESLGADKCVNYKAPDFAEQLAAATPGGIDRAIEGVGGDVFNTYLPLMATNGHIAFCGMIANYNGQATNWPNFLQIAVKGVTIHGFNVQQSIAKWATRGQEMGTWIKEGKLKVDDAENVVPASIEDVPKIWARLFSGHSKGKLVTKLA